ncbi:MAG: type II secretion system protein N [Bdellovibrionales bacterium]
MTRLSLKIAALMLLAGAIAVLAVAGPDLPRVPETPVKVPEIAATPVFPAAATASSEITERPLFRAGRRPATVAPAQVPAPAEAMAPFAQGSFTLLGIAVSSAGRTALVRPAAGKAVVLHEGDSLEGWRIEQIQKDGVILTSGENRQILSFPKPVHSTPTDKQP